MNKEHHRPLWHEGKFEEEILSLAVIDPFDTAFNLLEDINYLEESSRSAGDLARELLPEITRITEELFADGYDQEGDAGQSINSIRHRLLGIDFDTRGVHYD